MKGVLFSTFSLVFLLQACSIAPVSPTLTLAQTLTPSPSPFRFVSITPPSIPNTWYFDPGADLGLISPYFFGLTGSRLDEHRELTLVKNFVSFFKKIAY